VEERDTYESLKRAVYRELLKKAGRRVIRERKCDIHLLKVAILPFENSEITEKMFSIAFSIIFTFKNCFSLYKI